MSLAGIVEGPAIRGVGKNGQASTNTPNPVSSNALAQAATRAGLDATTQLGV